MITGVEVVRYELAFVVPMNAGDGLHESRSGLLLGLVGDDGRTGWGEAAPLPGWSRDEFARVEAALTGLAASIAGRPRSLEVLYPTVAAWLGRLPSAAAALDGALLDLASQRRGVSLAAHLAGGGEARETVPVNALITGESPEEAAEHAALAHAEGFRAFKLKVGGRPTDAEIDRIRAVRDAVGADCALRLDAERKWDAKVAAVMLEKVAPFDIEYVEDPVPDLDGLVQLALATDVPLAVDALLVNSDDPLGVVSASAADVVVLKPGAVGGLTTASGIADAAIDHGRRVVITSFLDSAIGLAGSVALAAALPGDGVAAGLATSYLFAENVAEPPRIRDGRIDVPRGPGLGVSPQTQISQNLDEKGRRK